jgi:hypothetical protein
MFYYINYNRSSIPHGWIQKTLGWRVNLRPKILRPPISFLRTTNTHFSTAFPTYQLYRSVGSPTSQTERCCKQFKASRAFLKPSPARHFNESKCSFHVLSQSTISWLSARFSVQKLFSYLDNETCRNSRTTDELERSRFQQNRELICGVPYN